jgi:tetratricopeptide (TPR) repeat protein
MQKDIETLTTLNHDFVKSVQGADVKRFDEILAKDFLFTWQRDLSMSHNNIGIVLQAQGSLVAALDSYRAGAAIVERLAKADPGNAGWQRDLSVSYNKIGDVLRAQGDLKATLEFLSRHASGEPGLDFLASLKKLAEMRRVALGEFAEALVSYRASLAIVEQLAKADTGNAGWQEDLSTSHLNIGDGLATIASLFQRPARMHHREPEKLELETGQWA